MSPDHAEAQAAARLVAADGLIADLERNIELARVSLDAALAGDAVGLNRGGAIQPRQWARELATLRLALDEARQARARALQASQVALDPPAA